MSEILDVKSTQLKRTLIHTGVCKHISVFEVLNPHRVYVMGKVLRTLFCGKKGLDTRPS